jgi:hypothetical protein
VNAQTLDILNRLASAAHNGWRGRFERAETALVKLFNPDYPSDGQTWTQASGNLPASVADELERLNQVLMGRLGGGR